MCVSDQEMGENIYIDYSATLSYRIQAREKHKECGEKKKRDHERERVGEKSGFKVVEGETTTKK